jgi:hypothetical protein
MSRAYPIDGSTSPRRSGEEVSRLSSGGGSADLSRTQLAFANHPLVPVHLVFDSISRAIALAKEQTDDFKLAFRRVLDAAVREKFHCLADAIFVL